MRRRKEFVRGGGIKTISAYFSIVLVTYLHKIPSPLIFSFVDKNNSLNSSLVTIRIDSDVTG